MRRAQEDQDQADRTLLVHTVGYAPFLPIGAVWYLSHPTAGAVQGEAGDVAGVRASRGKLVVALAFAGCLVVSGCAGVAGRPIPQGGATSPSAPSAPTESTPADSTPAASSISGVYEVTGSGSAITIDIDPAGSDGQTHFSSVDLPWQRPFDAPAGTQLFQVIAVGGVDAGCRILIDDEVVAEEPAGSAHCVYRR